MRILIAVSLFYPHAGGAEYQSLRLAGEFTKKGHQVAVVTRAFDGLPEEEDISGVKVFRKIRVVDRGMIFGFTYLLSLFAFLVRHRRDFDLVLTPQLAIDTAAAVTARSLTGVPVVARVACGGMYSDILRIQAMKGGSVLMNMARRVDGVIAVSGQIRDELEAAGFRKEVVRLIPNGVDTSAFAPLPRKQEQRAALGLPADGFIVLFMGRLDEQKGISYLLQAWSRIDRAAHRGLLLIVGEGELRGYLEQAAAEMGIRDDVRFVGKVSNAPEYLCAADVFVLPSLAEGMSNALLEAMATGLPCISTRNGSNEDLIENMKSGLLAPTRDAAALAEAIAALASDQNLRQRLGQKAREEAVRHYDLTRVAERHIEFYRAILQHKERHG